VKWPRDPEAFPAWPSTAVTRFEPMLAHEMFGQRYLARSVNLITGRCLYQTPRPLAPLLIHWGWRANSIASRFPASRSPDFWRCGQTRRVSRFAHNHAPPGRRNGGPTIFTFATVDDLDRFVATADMKIAALEVAAHRRRPKASASVPLGAALRVAFRAISRGSGWTPHQKPASPHGELAKSCHLLFQRNRHQDDQREKADNQPGRRMIRDPRHDDGADDHDEPDRHHHMAATPGNP
jgi:hypothetical protein